VRQKALLFSLYRIHPYRTSSWKTKSFAFFPLQDKCTFQHCKKLRFFWQKKFFLYNIVLCLFQIWLMKKKLVNNQRWHHWLFHVVEKNIWKVPISIRIISFSSFIFILWRWLWADTFFSLYIKTIVDNIFWVSVIWWWLSAIRLLFTICIFYVWTSK